MAITGGWRNKIIGAISMGAIAVASVMITGTNGKNGLEGREYYPYRDVAGVVTVCDGHTGKGIVWGKKYNDKECDKFLRDDLSAIALQTDKLIKAEIPDAMRGAIYSFAYNVGPTAFSKSTMLQRINANDKIGACEQMRRWVFAGGKKWQGLINRREVEREVCLWGVK